KRMYVFPAGGLDSADRYEVYPETLCQYTGLKDKNGKRIWENDIVQHVQRRAQRGVNLRVSWHTFKASWVLSKKGWMYNHFFEEGVGPEDVEVIGNFFDNPELLEDSDLTD
ncbi:MAG TPA: YopX family protein, partial [Candidatus Eisenbergiella merdigallinarum]|nr:YopX family protein [Candidatus Eisenbergiella merdigallinarum]